MFVPTLKYLFCYSQRALTPSTYSSLLLSTLPKQSLQQIMHNLHLYEHNITVFDYNYYQRIGYSLLDYQRKMSVGEIVTVLRLGMRHDVRNQMVWRHMEGELYRRLFYCMTPVLEAQEKEVKEGMGKLFKQLQAKSEDYFQILSDQFKQQQSSSPQPTALQQPSPQTTDLTLGKRSQQITKHAYDLVQILVWYGCDNIRFINLLLETQLHPLVLVRTPNAVIRYAELLVYACQVNMKEYQNNKSKYTARSIKRIYKFQGLYFPELIKNLKESLSQFTAEELKYITEVIRSFPVKKRQHRKNVVDLVSSQWKKRGEGLLEQEKQKIEEILANDKKLIAKFRQAYQIRQQAQLQVQE